MARSNKSYSLPPTFRKLARFLDVVSDNVNTLMPIVAIGIGVMLMYVLPKRHTERLFSTPEERTEFFSKYTVSIPADMPIFLGAPGCKACDELQLGLDAEGIRYQYLSVNDENVGKALQEKIRVKNATKDIPRFLFGQDLVAPALPAIRDVLGLPQPTPTPAN